MKRSLLILIFLLSLSWNLFAARGSELKINISCENAIPAFIQKVFSIDGHEFNLAQSNATIQNDNDILFIASELLNQPIFFGRIKNFDRDQCNDLIQKNRILNIKINPKIKETIELGLCNVRAINPKSLTQIEWYRMETLSYTISETPRLVIKSTFENKFLKFSDCINNSNQIN